MSSPNGSVAVLGLGIIGQAWARNLIADGLSVTCWNRTPRDFPKAVASVEAAVRDAAFIYIVVADPSAVRQVLDAAGPFLKAGQTVIQSSTISAAATHAFSELVEKTGARYLEAPFTGSKVAAEQRKTVFYIGGNPEILETARPILQRQAAHIMHIGSLGSASSLKLAMNMNLAMQLQGLCESLHFSRAAGIPDAVFFDALRVNVGRSGLSDLKEPKLRDADFAPQFSLKHMDKDMRLAAEDAPKLDLPQLTTLRKQFEKGMRAGLGEEDFSALLRLLG